MILKCVKHIILSNYKWTERYYIRGSSSLENRSEQATKWVHNDAFIQDFVRHKITLWFLPCYVSIVQIIV